MSNSGMIVIQSCVGSAFLTGLIGAFYIHTWIQFLLAFLVFAVIRVDHSERPDWAWRIPAFGRTARVH